MAEAGAPGKRTVVVIPAAARISTRAGAARVAAYPPQPGRVEPASDCEVPRLTADKTRIETRQVII